MANRRTGTGKIWIDLDNTPHVPFFRPIIRELKGRGHAVVCTARDAFQVCPLAESMGVSFVRVGRHHGRNPVAKLAGLFYRALQLMPFARREKPALAVSHGSRAQLIIANALRIPTVLLEDYEHAQYPPFMRPRWELVPEVVPKEATCCRTGCLRRYPGLKENVYVPDFRPDESILEALGLRSDEIVVTVRPPATEAHYHNREGETLFFAVLGFLLRHPEVRVILLPRNPHQVDWMKRQHAEWFSDSRVMIPLHAVDGLNLLWHSDLAVSGGGTMNREAAALGVPVYSIFRGRIGAVDRQLETEGRLVLVQHPEEIEQKIRVVRRPRTPLSSSDTPPTLSVIVGHIEEILRAETSAGR